MPRGSSVKKDNSTESQTVATIEKGFNLTTFYSSAGEKIAQFTATPGSNVYIVCRSICYITTTFWTILLFFHS